MARDLAPLAALAAALEGLVPEGVACAVEDTRQPEAEGDLFAAEAAAMTRAVPARRMEFAAGRRAVHRCMEELGLMPGPVPMGATRAPDWPEGLTGSISHCAGAAVAVLGFAGIHAGLAVDVEPDLPLPDDLIGVVCGAAERAWLDSLPEEARGRAARMLFSAKECAYKLQAVQGGKLLDFSDVEVSMNVASGAFSARFLSDGGVYRKGHDVAGRCQQVGGFILCVMNDPQAFEIV